MRNDDKLPLHWRARIILGIAVMSWAAIGGIIWALS